MQQKTEKNLFVSEIIAPELVSLNVPMNTKIIFMGGQCVNKQSQDFACQKGRLFQNSIFSAVINGNRKVAVMQISTVLGHVYRVACRRVH